MYIFICIGSIRIVGDSLGPMIGSFLKDKYKNNDTIKVYGDLEKQIDYYNIEYVLKYIEKIYNKNCTKIVIDSGLGNNVGSFWVNEGDIYLGKGLNKSKIVKGDLNIIGVVGKNYKDPVKNLIELKRIEEKTIKQMAMDVVRAININ